jgi:prepilin-type N-terminal cleavage/methylation domain-containing protein
MKFNKNFTKSTVGGFTLIELLVVIAIIGILSSIVLASLSTARSKGKDAATEEALSGARAQGEIYAASSSNSYAGACSTSAPGGGLGAILTGAASSSGVTGGVVTTLATAGTATTVICHDASTGWAASAPLSTTGTYWCVDNNGDSKSETVVLAASALVCN